MSSQSDLRQFVARVTSGERFSSDTMTQLVELLMTVDLQDAKHSMLAASVLCALKTRGETADEIMGAAKALRSHQIDVSSETQTGRLLDTCGTGGDGAHLINISTITGVVAAHLGAKVAKHGNRSVSSSCGSADLLEALEYPLLSNPQAVSTCIAETGFGFLFAPHFHPALKNLSGLRRELGVRTIFNMLGPLVNPAGASHQLIGVFDRKIVTPIARAAAGLGVEKCLVVHGEGGLDELSPNSVTWVSLAQGDKLEEFEWTPADFGAEPVPLEALAGGGPQENAKKCRMLFQGKDPQAARAIAMNAAASLWLLDLYPNIKEAYSASFQAIQSGKIWEYFENCRRRALNPTD